jgi:uncharacterized protein (TIGR02246 family)
MPMKRLFALCASAAMAISLTACQQSAPDTHDADVKAIGDSEAQWNADYKAKDLDRVMSHYADAAVLMVPGSPISKGSDAIRNDLKQMLADPAMALTFHASTVDVSKSGDLGFTQGSYNLTVTDPASHKVINDHGSYVTTYRKQADGSWKATADIATSDVPPAPPAH